MISLKSFYVPTTTAVDFVVVGHEVRSMMKDSAVQNGWVVLATPHTGASFSLGPARGEISESVKNQMKRQQTLLVPIQGGKLVTDPWQEIFLIDEETSGKRREFLAQIFAEEAPKK